MINCSDYATLTDSPVCLQFEVHSASSKSKTNRYGSQLKLNTGGIHFLRPKMSSNSGGKMYIRLLTQPVGEKAKTSLLFKIISMTLC